MDLAYLLATGAAVRRSSRLILELTADRRIRVTGAVIELGRDWIRL